MFDFDYRTCCPGTAVEASPDPSGSSMSKMTYGTVVKRGNGCVDIWTVSYVSGTVQFRILMDCWHIDDPRVRENPQAFQDGRRGVFRLAQSEIRARQIERQSQQTEHRIAAIERMLAVEVGKHEHIKTRLDAVEQVLEIGAEPSPKSAKRREPVRS